MDPSITILTQYHSISLFFTSCTNISHPPLPSAFFSPDDNKATRFNNYSTTLVNTYTSQNLKLASPSSDRQFPPPPSSKTPNCVWAPTRVGYYGCAPWWKWEAKDGLFFVMLSNWIRTLNENAPPSDSPTKYNARHDDRPNAIQNKTKYKTKQNKNTIQN